jgi:hypothetical protein
MIAERTAAITSHIMSFRNVYTSNNRRLNLRASVSYPSDCDEVLRRVGHDPEAMNQFAKHSEFLHSGRLRNRISS